MQNPNSRLEAFCDGVFAIAITLLIIEIKVPHIDEVDSKGELWKALVHEWPSWMAFLISFITILISWVNHSHALKLIDKTSTKFIYANGFLLFSVIILPFPTALVAEYIATPYAQPAVTFYCFASLLNNVSWILLMRTMRHPKMLYRANVDMAPINSSTRYVYYGLFYYIAACILSFWFPVAAFMIIGSSFIAWLIIGLTIETEE
jgi:uncharacterized membrane protein